MTDQPTTINKTANAVDSAIQSAETGIIGVVETMIIADVPALGFPIIKQLWEALFNWIAGYFTKAAMDGATFLVIDHQVDKEQSALSKALAALTAAQKTGNADEIKKAIQAYADCHSSLVHSDGSSAIH